MFANVSIWQLLIVLVIVIAIFGTKRLKSLGTDLGGAVKGFRSAMDSAEQEPRNSSTTNPKTRALTQLQPKNPPRTIKASLLAH